MSEALASEPNTRCARCGAGFHCGAHEPGPCACRALVLAPELLARLRDDFEGCLCLACLRELSSR